MRLHDADVLHITARRVFHSGYAVEFLSDATGTLSFKNEAGFVTDEELHRSILLTQASRFSKVRKADEWIEGIIRKQVL